MHKYAASAVALACCAAVSANAQGYCGSAVDGTASCTIPAGTYSETISIPGNAAAGYTVENQGSISVNDGQYALQVGGSQAAVNQPSSDFSVNSTGPVALANSSATPSAALQVSSMGGNGVGVGGYAGVISLAVNGTTVETTGVGANAIAMSQAGGAGGEGGDSSVGGVGGTVFGPSSLTLDDATVSASSGDALDVTQSGGAGGSASKGSKSSVSTGGQGGGIPQGFVGSITDSTIGASGSGIAITQIGGPGGNGPDISESDNQWANAGAGGFGGGIGLEFTSANVGRTTISTTGANAPAVSLSSTGGTGGSTSQAGGGLDDDTNAGNGGSGGESGNVGIKSTGQLTITTEGDGSPGILTVAQGGAGGSAGEVICGADCHPGSGGDGGLGAAVAITFGNGNNVATTGDNAPAIEAESLGGAGGAAGGANAASGDAGGMASGSGGASSQVSINLSGDQLATQGAQSPGLLVQSVGGQGGSSYPTGEITSAFGSAIGTSGGGGGNSGGASVTSGFGDEITTTGQSSPGIMVQVLSGPGGAGGTADGNFGSTGGFGGPSGTIANVTVSNLGVVTTSGAGSQGILVQSIAGGGGAGGSSYGFFVTSGGSANFANANAGAVSITDNNGNTASNSGAITTSGAVAAAILAESIGGGGGDGGSSSGVFYNQAGQGGAGGSGGTVTVNLDPNTVLSTAGVLSHGILAQSIGGSGGSGGNATSNGTVATYVVGGSAGPGGSGGTVAVNANGGRIELQGSGANGIVAQSVGGGGGAGGAAYALDVGNSFALAAAVGGTGGSGGAGGNVTVTTANTTISTGHPPPVTPETVVSALPVDAIGILAQSVSGGGGAGGGASAQAVAIGMQNNTNPGSAGLAITATYSVGGKGGDGGSASSATVAAMLQDGTNVETAGAGSIGVLAQAIGGGGGQGGDSSTFSATIGSANKYFTASGGTTTVSLNFSAGATGGPGGAGGTVTADLGNAAGGTASIATTGDYADGVLAQSIGGGGGNAGAGSSAMHTTGAGSAIKFSVDLGAQGGAGGAGGPVTVDLDPESTVSTSGSGAVGVIAQSIGGGGGNSTGYTVNLAGLTKPFGNSGAASKVQIGFNPTIGLGAAGGSGDEGGGVTALSEGHITTIADDAPGLLLQSIGGGGGVGGSPGQDAASTGDSSESPGGSAATAEGEPSLSPGAVTFAANTALSLGGAGGVAADGGTVTLTEQGTVRTSGDYSPGVIAQSIGGGGGRGGTAIVGTQNDSLKTIVSQFTVYANVSLGVNGSGGGGGTGGEVNLSLNGAAVATGVADAGSSGTGFQSFGVLAQSIGAGGGIAGDGTSGPNGITKIGAGVGGANGDGGSVTIQQTGGTANTVSTSGDYASGIVAQSIGGGGGVYGGGSAGPVPNTLYTGNVTLELGAQAGGGNGGSVTFPYPGLNITTTGNGAFGVLAQSIGAGGGLAAVGGAATVSALGAANGVAGNGGSVTVDLGSNGSITTSGISADGVVAQSIGGGGGVALLGSSGSEPSFTTERPYNGGSIGTGGAVSVETHGPITVTGAGAFGIVAQSISGGGGLATTSPGVVFGGSTNGGAGQTSAGNVTVTTQGSIKATGENGIAIFAQAAQALSDAQGSVTVDLESGLSGGTVEGGSGSQGYGVWVNGGNTNNQLTVGSGAALSALSGNAINYTGGFLLNSGNNGEVAGDQFNLGGGTFTNNSRLVLAGPGAGGPYYGAATLRGNLVQSASGQIDTDVDFAARRAGHLVVTGDAALGGTIVPRVATVLPRVNLPVLMIDGTMTGTIRGGHSTLFAYDAHDPPSEVTLSARTTGFAPAGFGVRGSAGEVASYLLPVFNTATTPELGTLFATLGNLADADPRAYVDALRELSPNGVLAFASRARSETVDFGQTLLNCQGFGTTRAVVTNRGCAWMEVGGGLTDQSDAGGYAGFSDSTVNYRVGGEAELAPGWLVGGAFGYAHSWLNGDTGTDGEGNAGYAGISLTRAWLGWRFSGALLGSFSSNSTHRAISIPGFESVLNGQPNVDTEAAALRADYTFDLGRAYIRPAMTVDVVRVHAGAFSETGEKTVGLAYGSSAITSAVFAPNVEFGLRTTLQNGMALRSYLTLGASLPTTSKFAEPVRLQGAALAAGSYEAAIPTDSAAATVGVGVQVFASRSFDLRLAYDGAFASRVTENTGTLVGTLHF